MIKHVKYLTYVLRHKWYVLLECCRAGVPLSGILHDIDKFYPDEWFPYVEQFYGSGRQKRDATGAYDPNAAAALAFRVAWLKHWHRNPHHWEHWLSYGRSGVAALPMPDRYRREMLADWRGASRAQGKGRDVLGFYQKNGPTMLLHDSTRLWVEHELGVTPSCAS